MAIIIYLLGCVLMADIIADEEETNMVPWIIGSMVWPLEALIILWYGIFPPQNPDN